MDTEETSIESGENDGSFLNVFDLTDDDYDSGEEVNTEEKKEEVNIEAEDAKAEAPIEDEKKPEEAQELENDLSEEEQSYGQLMEELTTSGDLLFSEGEDYEPSIDGIRKLVSGTKDSIKQSAIDEYKASFGENQRLIEYLQDGGTPEQFYEEGADVDYNTVSLYNEDKSPHEGNMTQIIYDYIKAVDKTATDEEIELDIEAYKKAGTLEKRANISLPKMRALQETRETERSERVMAQKEDAVKMQTEFKEKVTGTRELKGFNLSEEKAAKLHAYITEIGDDGKTQYDRDTDTDTQLLHALMTMEKFDSKNLIAKEKTRNTIRFKNGLSNFRNTDTKSTRSKDDPSGDKDSSIEDIWSYGK